MNVYYDLHIHSCLSPCGDNDMTPNNIVNMAMLNGLDMIALTDHNSCKNCPAAVAVGKSVGVTVVPGMELTTCEDIHVVCYFPDCDSALSFSDAVDKLRVPIENNPEIFGDQLIMDENDDIIGKEPNLLINSCNIGIMDVKALVHRFGGACIPAHVDRDSYSIISVLGEIVPECGFDFIEVSTAGDPKIYGHPFFISSDAHYLENISERERTVELKTNEAQALIDLINGGC